MKTTDYKIAASMLRTNLLAIQKDRKEIKKNWDNMRSERIKRIFERNFPGITGNKILYECLERGIPFIQGLSQEVSNLVLSMHEIGTDAWFQSASGTGAYLFLESGVYQSLEIDIRESDYDGSCPYDHWKVEGSPTIGEQIKSAPSAQILLVFEITGYGRNHYSYENKNAKVFVL